MKKLLTICTPVADLRSQPIPPSLSENKDIFQDSQLIFGEKVVCLGVQEDWLKVCCMEQKRFSITKGWHGYPGWIRKNQVVDYKILEVAELVVKNSLAIIYQQPGKNRLLTLSFGSYLKGISLDSGWWKVSLFQGNEGYIQASDVVPLKLMKKMELAQRRKSLVDNGKKFLHSPYVWGGRSAYNPTYQGISGVDCSALINLIYRFHGILIPRDAKDQFLKSKSISAKELQPGDLIFLSKEAKVYHVIMYTGREGLLESAMEPNCVREISFFERFGKSLSSVENGIEIEGSRIWLKSILAHAPY